jgi:hypothetical protein
VPLLNVLLGFNLKAATALSHTIVGEISHGRACNLDVLYLQPLELKMVNPSCPMQPHQRWPALSMASSRRTQTRRTGRWSTLTLR